MEKGDNMEHIAAVMPLLWEIISRNKKCSINVTSKENEIIVSIWSGRRWKRFKGIDACGLASDIRQSYC
jgi:hypothetical protein